jgi:Uma2 family endonuclease
VGDRALVRVQLPVRLDENHEPQPNLALVVPRADRYRSQHPAAADVLLLIEVSNSSLGYDRGAKLRLYGTHGIVEYWIVNLPERVVEVCRQPRAGGYGSMQRFSPGAELDPAALPGVRIGVSRLFS